MLSGKKKPTKVPFVTIMEARTEKDAMKLLIPFVDVAEVEALTAIPRVEAIKLL